MKSDDPRSFAEFAGLVYTSPSEPGIRRLRCGRGFTYKGPDGRTIYRNDPARQRLDGLVIPPAWSDVWICQDENGHLQATGEDTQERRQYRYHDRWESERRSWRFARLESFALCLPRIRARVNQALDPDSTSHDAIHAAAVRILDALALRVGNRTSASVAETYGLTTLQSDHANITRRKIALSFRGKGGSERHVELVDKRLASILDNASELEDDHLLSWREPDATGHVTGASLRAWLKDAADKPITARMFRTWRASVEALDGLSQADWGPPTTSAVIDVVTPIAEQLGHTVATCRNYYIHEAIEQRYLAGQLSELGPGPKVTSLSKPERRLLGLIREHTSEKKRILALV